MFDLCIYIYMCHVPIPYISRLLSSFIYKSTLQSCRSKVKRPSWSLAPTDPSDPGGPVSSCVRVGVTHPAPFRPRHKWVPFYWDQKFEEKIGLSGLSCQFLRQMGT